MSDHVWVSAMIGDTRLISFMMTDITLAADELKVAAEGIAMWKAGKSVPPELCPKAIWCNPDKPKESLGDLFNADGFWIVSERAAEVLRQFDLGGGALYPVNAFKSDRKTPFDGRFYCWIFGNTKTAFREEHSPEIPPMGGSDARDWCKLPLKLMDDQVAISRLALTGPDVWIDPILFRGIFLSAPLGDALAKAGLKKAFRLFRARVI